MKKILVIVMASVLCLGLIGGAFAYFTDTETSNGNIFQAGSMNLKYGINEAPTYNNTNDYFSISNVYPGQSGSLYISFLNEGTVNAAHLKMAWNTLVDYENGRYEQEIGAGDLTDTGDLSPFIEITHVWIDKDGNSTFDPGETNLIPATVALSALAAGDDLDLGALNTGVPEYVYIAWQINTAATSIIQTDSTTVNALFTLSQN
jgi:spore coat-associated protein N